MSGQLAAQRPALLNRAAEVFARKPFQPHRIFSGAHAQTLAAYAWPRPYRFNTPKDEQRLFEVEPGVKILAECRWQKARNEHATVVIWHGIEGSTSSVYMIATADKAFRAGFNVVRVNYRNCGGTEHLTPTLYHGGLSCDVRAVLDELIKKDGLERIIPIGYSLGGNLVLKFAAECDNNPPAQVMAVCVVSPSVNLRSSTDLVGQGSNRIYEISFVRRLKRRMIQKKKLFPELYDLTNLAAVRSVREFDECFTAPAHGFADANDYYQQSSSIHTIDRIRIPTLIIHAQDDPFIPFEPLWSSDLNGNPNILLLSPLQGGHVAFISGDRNGDEDRFWAENRAVEFCSLAVEDCCSVQGPHSLFE
jgi:predicted alpha/beta-fold hydrolase